MYLGLVQVWYVSQHPSSLILRQKLISFGWNCPRYIGGSVQQMQFGHLCNDWGRFCDIDGAWAKSVISPQLSTIHIFHTKLIMDINPSRTQHSEPLNHLLLGMGTHNFQPYLFKSCSLMPFTSQSLCPPGSLHNEKIFRTMQTFFLEAKIHGFVEV